MTAVLISICVLRPCVIKIWCKFLTLGMVCWLYVAVVVNIIKVYKLTSTQSIHCCMLSAVFKLVIKRIVVNTCAVIYNKCLAVAERVTVWPQ